ncbi:MAG: V-type ATP synthase subunit D [Clostridiaceae bacterium]|nr:V-type ATP synthase subunit D [Clostridiaceae bacterium]
MAMLRVNPTRMELTRLKTRLKTARRGHKLLKDKLDEMMKRFLELIRENKKLRAAVEDELSRAHSAFSVASAVMSPQMLAQALSCPKQSVSLTMDARNIMGVSVPVFHAALKNEDPGELFPYGFATTSAELDDAIDAIASVQTRLLALAETEKTTQLLARDIEKTRRRVNALEYVMIPQLEETIRYITMKLDENERGNLTRLMKVKDMMLEEARRKVLERETGCV